MNVMLNGFSLACTDAGQGLPLVLVHGYPLNRQMWQPQVKELSGQTRVLAPDLRGHGDSPVIQGPHSMDLFADDLNALLDGLGIQEKIILCGLSMGGYVTFAFFRKYAHRLRGLILTATRAAPDSEQALAARDQAIQTAVEKGVNPIFESMAPKLLSPQTASKLPAMLDLAMTVMRRTPPSTVVKDLQALKARQDSRPTLPRINLPTLIIHGEDDQIVPIQEAREMQAQIPGSRLAAVPAAGHLLNLEQPQIFNRAVQEFLDELG